MATELRAEAAGQKGFLHVRPYKGKYFYEARWRDLNRVQRRRRLGRAWVELDADGDWAPRRGRVRKGFLDERRAYPLMAAVIEAHEEKMLLARLTVPGRPKTLFTEAVKGWLDYLKSEKRVKPSTLAGYKRLLVDPEDSCDPRRGRIVREFGHRRLDEITVADARRFLARNPDWVAQPEILSADPATPLDAQSGAHGRGDFRLKAEGHRRVRTSLRVGHNEETRKRSERAQGICRLLPLGWRRDHVGDERQQVAADAADILDRDEFPVEGDAEVGHHRRQDQHLGLALDDHHQTRMRRESELREGGVETPVWAEPIGEWVAFTRRRRSNPRRQSAFARRS